MGNEVKQVIKIEEIVDIRQAIRGIDEIKENLSKLSLGPGLQSEFDRVFQKIERNTEKANKAMASGFKNKGDVKAYEEAMRQISSAYDQIITKVKVLNSNKEINLQIDDAQVKNLNDEIDSIKNNLKDLKTYASQAGKDLGKAIKAGATHNKGGASYWNDAIKAFEDGKIDETEKAIKKLEGTVKAAQTRAKGAPLSDEWQQKADDVKALRDALERYKTAQKDVTTEDSNLIAKKKELSDVMSKGAALLTETADVGKKGAEAFNQYARESAQAAQSTQQLNSELEHFKGKAAYFFGLSNAINLFKRALRSAYDTVKDLDAVMTETAVVTNFDVGDMWSQLPEYTQRANELGVSIHSAYEAATIFYQQGLKTNEVMAVSNETLKMARIAGLDAATASDRMTNALRGFNMEMDKMNAQRVNDVYSKLAAITASDTDEISTAMTKVASLAHNANMEFETTSAFLAQMIETTRESAETAGTALKTVIARFSEVKKLYSKGELLGQDEEGGEIDVNKVSTALRSAGINLNEYLTGAKGLDDIFIELASKWDSLDKVQQRYIATMAAGSRQQSRFIAMMSDYGRTMELVDAANNANGASQEQYAKTLESLQTKLSRLKNAWDEFVLGLANSDAIKGAVDALTDLITAINALIKGISKGNASVKMITTFFTAFTGFKIGQKAFGGTQVGKFFSGLTQIAGTQGKVGAVEFTKNFYSKLSDKITSYGDKGGFAAKIKDQFSDIYGGLSQYLNPARNRKVAGLAKGSSKEEFLTGVVNKFSPDVSNEGIASFREKVGTQLEEGTLTLDSLNDALDKSGQKFKITEKNAKDFGIVLDNDDGVIQKSTVSMRQLSAGAVVVGGALMGIGSALEATEGPFKVFGTVLKVAGAGILAFGTIMSVYLPLQAQLMAKGVTGAIVSIPIIGWIAGVISALVALGVALHSFSKNYSFEARMNKANEACKNAADAADEAAKAYEKLGQAWDSLNDKYSAIDNAVAGTQQWKEAIKDANAEVLNLVGTYEGLETKIGEDGRLIITEESKTAVKDKLGKTQEYTQAASIGAQLARNEIKDKKAKEGYDSWNILGGYIGEKWTNSKGDVYTEDKVREEIVQAIREGRVQDTYDLKELVKSMVPEDRQNFVDWKIRDYEFNGMKEYAQTEQFSDASQAQFNGLISNALSHISNKDAVNLGKNLISTGTTEALYKKTLEDVEKKDKDWKQNLLASRAGYDTYEDWKQKANNGQDISEEELNRQIAAQEVQGKLNNFVTQFESKMGNLTEEQLKYFQQEGGGALTAKDFKEIREKGEGGAREIVNRIGDKEYFENLGIDREGYIAQLQKELDEAEKYVTIKSGSILEGLGENITKNLTAGVGKSLTENFESVFISSGQEGVDTLQKQIKALTDGMSPEKAKAFTAALGQIDWTSTNSIHSLSDLAAEYGIADDRIETLENDIIKLNNASLKVDLSKLTEQLKSLFKIGKGIKTGTQGRNFSEDDYKKLTEQAGVDADKFVYNIETGEYNYTGQLSDILKAVNELVSNSFNTKQLEKDIASGQVAQDLFSKNGNINNVKDKSSFVKDYINQAGENSKIKSMAWSQAYDDIRLKNDYTAMNKLYEIIKNDKDKLGENEAALNTTKFNADVMQRQMNYGVANAEDAIRGSKSAQTALQGQIASLGLPKDLQERLLAGMETNSGNFQESSRISGNIVDTFTQAKANGISAEDLNAYADALTRVEGLENKRADELYAMALAEAKYNEGMKSLVSSYDDWSKLIDKKGGGFKIPQPDTAAFKVYTKMKEDVEKMLNSSEKIPDEFFKSAKNAELLKKAVNQDKKAAAELAANLAKVNIGDLGSEEKNNKVNDWIDEIQKKIPNLKIGTTFDENSIEVKLAQLLAESGKTVDEINKIMGNIGMGIEWEAKEVDVKSYQESHQGGTITIPDGNGTKQIPVDDLTKYETNGKAQIMMPKKATFNKPPKLTPPKTKKKGGKGGGGKKSKAKKERWENPYDELYNLQEKINESLRKREALERRYQKLLKQEQSSLSDIRKAYYDQIKQIRTEANLQKELEAGRRRQIENLGKQTYVDSKGNVKTFEQMGVTKYAGYNFETGQIELDWGGLQALEGSKNVEKGKAAEAFISKLEELVSSYEEVRDKLWELEDKIEEFREAAIDAYLSFEDRVMDALVDHYQKEIDSYQAMSDAIDKVNNEVISSLREQIDLSRQIRDNTEKEEDISKKENRLAYLQRDTSGANDLEILSLQKELKDAREGYSDTLVDQAIDKMQKDADTASEQRQRQIETMQTQLDIAKETGALWKKVYTLMSDTAKSEIFSEDSELAKLLKDGEAFKALSNIGQKNWWAEVGKAFREAIIGRDEAEDKFQTDANNDGTIANTGTSDYLKKIGEMNTQANVTADTYERTDEQNYGAAAAILLGGKTHGGWGAERNWASNLKEKGFDPDTVLKIYDDFVKQKKAWDADQTKKQKAAKKKKKKYTKKAWTGWKVNGVTDWKNYQMSRFKTGGLADKTGPAWLDGTRSHPELVLNSQDTRNFIALKDILASLMNPQNKANTAAVGNVYLDIDINADIGSDYDVDKLANRIKKQIFDEGQYRNINTINFLR